jgi:uncharacterized protein DUF1616
LTASSTRRRAPLLLLGALLWVAAAVAAVLLDAPTAVRAALGVPLVLLLPGFALVSAFLPAGAPAMQRLVLAVSSSIALVIGTALALAAAGADLDQTSWIAALGGVTAALLVVAIVRWRPAEAPRRRPHVTVRQAVVSVLAVTAAVVVTAYAVDISRRPAEPTASARPYTLLWIDPSQQEGLRIGLTSGELAPTTYRVEVVEDGQTTGTWAGITLEPGASWATVVVPAGSARRVDVFAYRDADGTTPYRHVYVHPGDDAAGDASTDDVGTSSGGG